MRGRHGLTDAEWAIISPLLPDKPRGDQRVDDRRAISGIVQVSAETARIVTTLPDPTAAFRAEARRFP